MEKVIDITERLKERGRPQDEDIKRLEAIKRIVTCAFCLYRCGMCGAKIQEGNYIDKVNLCKACYMEYLDYLELKKRRLPLEESLGRILIGRGYGGSGSPLGRPYCLIGTPWSTFEGERRQTCLVLAPQN